MVHTKYRQADNQVNMNNGKNFDLTGAIIGGVFMIFIGYIGTASYFSSSTLEPAINGSYILMAIMFLVGFFVGGYANLQK